MLFLIIDLDFLLVNCKVFLKFFLCAKLIIRPPPTYKELLFVLQIMVGVETTIMFPCKNRSIYFTVGQKSRSIWSKHWKTFLFNNFANISPSAFILYKMIWRTIFLVSRTKVKVIVTSTDLDFKSCFHSITCK